MTPIDSLRAPRRHWLLGAAVTAASVLSLGLTPLGAQAQFRIDISGVGGTQIPVALGKFKDEARSPQPLSAIIRADLERAGLFKVLDATADRLDENGRPAFADWRSKGADGLAAGSVTALADGRYDIRYHLWDVLKGKDLGGLSIVVPGSDLRQAAHRIADDIYEHMTGDKGYFATRIAYVSKVGNRHTLVIADSDGEGAQNALTSMQPIISPCWSPDGNQLAYVSFEHGKAEVMAQDVLTGRRRIIAAFKGSNSAPAWSPDGRQLAVTLSREGGSQLYLMTPEGEGVRRLTQSGAIDTEATWTPDGRSIYFVSDRGGGPQVYKIAATGGDVQRITFGGGYNISPAISPDGRWMAYISQVEGGAFRLHVMDLSSGNVRSLTDTREDESPSFAPNSRQIIYATRSQGRDVLMMTSVDGRIKARLATPAADVREPVWAPPVGGLRR
jgi:TolB protein